ncbi:MAG: hypothetical protein AN485_23420, partial [Anabaena sp. MDT14b]
MEWARMRDAFRFTPNMLVRDSLSAFITLMAMVFRADPRASSHPSVSPAHPLLSEEFSSGTKLWFYTMLAAHASHPPGTEAVAFISDPLRSVRDMAAVMPPTTMWRPSVTGPHQARPSGNALSTPAAHAP